jgi:hypothetical protein
MPHATQRDVSLRDSPINTPPSTPDGNLTGCRQANWARELREVVKAAYERGELERRGETEKDAIDIHSKRLRAALRLPKKRS